MTSPAPPSIESLLRHERWVRALARSLLRDAARADDVAQETWLAAIESPPRDIRAERSWLATVARRFALDARRGDERRSRREERAARPEGVAAAADVVAAEAARRRVVGAVLALAEPHRSVVLLRYFEDLPPRRIARRLGVPVETVRTRLKRALALLKERLDAEHGGDRRAAWLLFASLARRGGGAAAAIVKGASLVSAKKSIVAATAAVLLGVVATGVSLWRTSGRPALPAESGGAAASSRERGIGSRPANGASPADDDALPAGAGAAATARVTGLVIASGGLPVAGARVTSIPRGDAKAAVRDECNESGRFSVDVAADAGPFTVVAEAAGLAPAALDWVLAGEEVVLELKEGGTIAGVVVDVEGRPVALARVRFSTSLAEARVACEGLADASGRYCLTGVSLPWGHPYGATLDARADGFAPLSLAFYSSEFGPVRPDERGPVERNIVLARGARVEGRVLDGDTRAPLGGVTIRYRPFDASLGDEPASPIVSAADGSFAIPHLPARGFYDADPTRTAGTTLGRSIGVLLAHPDGYAPAAAEVPLRSDGDAWDAEILCWPRIAIRGRVFDGSGEPLSGVAVVVYSQRLENHWQSRATSDAAGRYVIDDVCASRAEDVPVQVFAQWPGPNPPPAVTIEVVVRAGADVEAPDIVLDRLPEAKVEVVDWGGRPIAGARVLTVARPANVAATRTDAAGRARLAFPQAPRAPVVVVAEARGFARTASPEFHPAADDPPAARIALPPGHGAVGRVRYESGRPAAGASVAIADAALPSDEAFPPPGVFAPGASPLFRTARVYDTAPTDMNGAFTFEGLPPGPYHLEATTAPLGPGRPAPGRARLENVPTDAVELLLTLPDPEVAANEAAVVRGTVRDSRTGRVVGRCGATLARGATTLRARADLPGRFVFDSVPTGEWTLAVHAPGYVSSDGVAVEVGCEGPARPIDVLLDPGARVSGTIALGPGVDLGERDYSLHFVAAGRNERFKASLRRDGTYVAAGLPPGRYRPSISAWNDYMRAGVAPESGVELLVPSGATEIAYDFRAVRAGAVNLVFEESPLLESSEAPRFVVRDERGRIAWEQSGVGSKTSYNSQLPVGAYVLEVFDGDREVARRTFAASAEELRTIVLVE